MTKTEIKEKLKSYLGDEYKESVMSLLVDKAYDNVKLKRNYPTSYSNAKIENDMSKFGWQIFDIVLNSKSSQGNENEKQHTENGVSITWQDANINNQSLYADIIPIARVVS